MKRILILSNQPLFGQGIESLLRQAGRFDVVGHETDIDRAIECASVLRPDVVIVDSTDPLDEPAPAVIRILRASPGIGVICLNLQSNTLWVYHGEAIVACEVEDLLRAIEHSSFSPSPIG